MTAPQRGNLMNHAERTEKHCPSCKTVKPLTDYNRNRYNRDGYGSQCKRCQQDRYADTHRARSRRLRSDLRAQVIALLGGRCAVCSHDGSEFRLEIDHVNNDGKAHRQTETDWTAWKRLVESGHHPDYELQLLCRPHHVEKTRADRAAKRLQAA